MLKRNLLFMLLLLLPQAGYGQEQILLTEEYKQQLLMGEHAGVFIDSTNKLQIQDMSQQAFVPVWNATIGGMEQEPDAPWRWLRFKVNALQTDAVVFSCRLGRQGGQIYWKHQADSQWKTADLQSKNHFYKNAIYEVFPVSLRKGEYTFYVKAKLLSVSTLFRKAQYDNVEHAQAPLFLYFCFGALALVLFYNVFLFLATSDKLYLFYAIYLVCNILMLLHLSGITYQHEILFSHPDFHLGYINFPTYFTVLALLYFSWVFFLKEALSKKWHYVLYFLSILSVLGGAGMPWQSFQMSNNIISVIGSLGTVYLLVAGFWAWLKVGYRNARFFALAFLFYITGVNLHIAVLQFTVLPLSYITTNFILIGSVVEAVFLSFALADRINTMKREREEAQTKALELKEKNEEILREQNQKLEEKVRERTQEIQQKQEEILTQNEELQQQQEEIYTINERLGEQVSEIRERNRAINDSIRYARTIQEAVLPHIPRLKASFQDSFVLYKPQHIVSGDFFWFRSFENYKLLAVGDCTGHGVPGAFMSLLGMSFLDHILTQNAQHAPALMLEQMNRLIIENLRQERTGNQDGMELIICCIKPDQVIFSASKRSLFIVEKGRELQEYKGTRRYIGNAKANAQKKHFEEHIIKRAPDMMLYLSSDGFQDQLNDDRKRFGSRAFKALLEDIAHRLSSEQKEQLETHFFAHKGNMKQIDDVTVLGVRL